jgi:hypothetical protein
MCHKIRICASLAVLSWLGITANAPADETDDDEGLDRTPESCISTNRIRDTKVIDNRTILFRMRGGDYYTNILDRECPGLAENKRFMHESNGRLCDIDTITVLEQWVGRLAPGFTCQLGEFHPITELEADDLELGPDATTAASNAIEIREVQLPPGETVPVTPEKGDPDE